MQAQDSKLYCQQAILPRSKLIMKQVLTVYACKMYVKMSMRSGHVIVVCLASMQ